MKNHYQKRFLFAAVALLLSISFSYSQQTEIKRYMVVKTSPKYTLQVNLNYNQSILELNGTYNDDYQSRNVYEGETFGADKGFGIGVISKLGLDQKGWIRFTQSLAYNRILSYTFGDKKTVADNGKASFNIITGGLGFEYNFTPAHRYKIYVGAEANASLINGAAKIWFYTPGIPTSDSDYTITNSFRMGYSVVIGSEFLINNKFGLNIGARLTNANILFKKSEGTNADREFPLRDADAPGLNFAGKKNFAFYSITMGINFYFGISEKRYKLN